MIKFRVFNKSIDIYHNNFVREMLVHKDNENNCFVVKGYHDCQIIEQFTGLQDKNGKEIFEGDIIKVDADYETYGFMAGEIREVIFTHGGFRLKPINAKNKGHWLEDGNDVEVIGNIHENKELLK